MLKGKSANYKKSQDVMFNQIAKTVSTNKSKPTKIPSFTQDIISAFSQKVHEQTREQSDNY